MAQIVGTHLESHPPSNEEEAEAMVEDAFALFAVDLIAPQKS